MQTFCTFLRENNNTNKRQEICLGIDILSTYFHVFFILNISHSDLAKMHYGIKFYYNPVAFVNSILATVKVCSMFHLFELNILVALNIK